MAAVPRIARAVPHGPITRPEAGLPVIARLRWVNGQDEDVLALAVAWTHDAVEISWQTPLVPQRTDWIPAAHVRRTTAEPLENTDTPNTRGRKGRRRA